MARRRPGMVMNQQTSGKTRLIAYICGFVAIFYVCMLLGSAWVPECTFEKWLNNFTQFVLTEHHFIVGFTEATPMIILVAEVAWTASQSPALSSLLRKKRSEAPAAPALLLSPKNASIFGDPIM